MMLRKAGGLAAIVLFASSCSEQGNVSPLTYCQKISMVRQQGLRTPLDICNGFDDDCDGDMDEQCDRDNDGYCDSGAMFQNCAVIDPSEGCLDDIISIQYFRADNERMTEYCSGTFSGCADEVGCPPIYDCDDFDAAINPGAQELCDDADNDCDGAYNEDFPEKGSQCYEGDQQFAGKGDCSYGTRDCLTRTDGIGGYHGTLFCDGYVLPSPEICDARDNDCDMLTDEDAPTQTCYYELRYAGDGTVYTLEASPEQREKMDDLVSMCRPGIQMCVEYCSPREIDEGTCIPGIYGDECYGAFIPRDTDECDCQDEDCDGIIDNAYNADGDGYSQCACPVVDCDDYDASRYPGAPETCNDGIDQDCDGQDAVGQDQDGDGYLGGESCANGDCKDDNAMIHPGAQEICNCQDDNCDGQIDEGYNLRSYDHLFILDCSGSMDDVREQIITGYSNASIPDCYSQSDYIKMSTAYVSRMTSSVVSGEPVPGEPVLVNTLLSPGQFQQDFSSAFPENCNAYETSLDAIAYAACARIWSRDETHPYCDELQEYVEDFLRDDAGEMRALWRPYSQAFIHYLGDEIAQTQHEMTPSKVRVLLQQAQITMDLYIQPGFLNGGYVTTMGNVRAYQYEKILHDNQGECVGFVHNLNMAVEEGSLVSDFTSTVIGSYCSEDDADDFDCEMEPF